MGKKRNEVNGVLVYRRWCLGAIFSMLLLIAIAAPFVLFLLLNWMSIGGYSKEVSLKGIDLLYLVDALKGNGFLNGIRDITNYNNFASLTWEIKESGAFKLFDLLNNAILWTLFSLMAITALLVVIDLIFAFFYLITGRVVNPAAPVKLSWAIFVFMLLLSGGTLGYSIFLKTQGAAAGFSLTYDLFGKSFGFALFPFLYAAGSLVLSILLSIVYVNSFKDKFYIGRAKRFGSGGTNQYQTNQYYQAPAPSQPQVIIVNGGGYPQNGQVVVPAQAPNANSEQAGPVQVINTPQADERPVTPRGILPTDIKSIGGHAFSKNLDLKYADVPSGIKELGAGAFANCLNLEIVSIPVSVKRIKKNCFFNCVKLARINYGGTKSEWRYVVRGSNWLDRAGTRTVVCSDGAIIVDPHR